jgi:NTP pyrophosphatase (non-canonical NTP hydrolase)
MLKWVCGSCRKVIPSGSIKCNKQKCVEYWIEKCKEQLTFHLSALTTEIAVEDARVAANSKALTLDEYQLRANETAIYPNRGANIGYTALGLCGEAGELANEVKKIGRDDSYTITGERRERMIAELGDVLWYVALLAVELHVLLGDVAAGNLEKLQARKQAGTLKGSGGDR